MANVQINVLLTASVSQGCNGGVMGRDVVCLSPRPILTAVNFKPTALAGESEVSFHFHFCWCDTLCQLLCRENDWCFIWACEMVMWLLLADVWFWQLPIHPHTDGLQSVNFSKMWHLTLAYMKCVYGWAYATSSPNFLGWIVYQIFLPMVLRKRALRERESSAKMKCRWIQVFQKFVPIVNCILRKAFSASLGKCKLIQVRNLSK